MITVAVLAGNIREFSYFIQEQKPACLEGKRIGSNAVIHDNVEYFYLGNGDQLRGLKDYVLLTYGTYYERRDINKIFDIHKIKVKIQSG